MTEHEPRTIRQMRAITLLLAAAAFMAVVSGGSGVVVQAVPGAPIADNAAGGDEGGAKGSVWVVNRDLGELAIFDAETGTLIEKLKVGAGAHDICISEKAGKAYITAEAINAVTPVDIETLATGSIAVGPLPHHIEPSHDGRSIFVTLASHPMTVPAPGTPAFATIDTDDNSVTYTTTSANPAARSHAVFPTPDGDRVFVAHDTGNEVSGIEVGTPGTFLSVSPILRAEEVVATRFGDQLWVSSRGDGTVKRIDIATQAVTASVAVGSILSQPESVMLTPNERTLVVSMRGTPATLAFVDTLNLELIGTVQIGPAGSLGDLAVMTNNGHYVYATFDAGAGGTGGVALVDVATRTVVRDWPYPGTGRPHGIWYSRKKPRF
jgi:DNA-binding beta-propeller fold protein YncE